MSTGTSTRLRTPLRILAAAVLMAGGALLLVGATWTSIADPASNTTLGSGQDAFRLTAPFAPWLSVPLAGLLLVGATLAARRERFWFVMAATLGTAIVGLVAAAASGTGPWFAIWLLAAALVASGRRFYRS